MTKEEGKGVLAKARSHGPYSSRHTQDTRLRGKSIVSILLAIKTTLFKGYGHGNAPCLQLMGFLANF
jgi:hypothetical protein